MSLLTRSLFNSALAENPELPTGILQLYGDVLVVDLLSKCLQLNYFETQDKTMKGINFSRKKEKRHFPELHNRFIFRTEARNGCEKLRSPRCKNAQIPDRFSWEILKRFRSLVTSLMQLYQHEQCKHGLMLH